MRKRVYIAGPISKGDLAANIRQGTEAFRDLAKAGYAPWCPQWSCFSHAPSPMDSLHGRAAVSVIGTAQGGIDLAHGDWLAVDLAWVAVADAVLRLPGESTGADAEVAEAKRLGVPVFHSIEELTEKLKGE